MGLADTLAGLNDFLRGKLGEAVEYNGEEITVLISGRGADREEGETGTDEIERMDVTVSLEDVASPGIEDTIVYKSETWQAVRILERCDTTRLARLEFERKTAKEGARGEYRKK